MTNPQHSGTSRLHPAAPLLVSLLCAGTLPAAPVINEIHYNNDLNFIASEFVEIFNPGPEAVDLADWSIEGGVDFTFIDPTPLGVGEYLVIAESPATILSRFGITARGPYLGGLSGDGEEIRLVNEFGLTVDRVDYGVNFPWPTAADGAGSSMELINPSLDNDLGGSWRSSAAGTQTPGAVNTVSSPVAAPHIRQVQHTPEQPTDAEAIVITAKVTDPEGVGTVELQYRLVIPGQYVPSLLAKTTSALLSNPTGPRTPNPAYETGWVAVAMLDDGNGDDAVAGDDIYTATVAAQPNRTLVRYRIRVADVPGEEIRVPYPDDESLNFACFVYNGIPSYGRYSPAVLETLPAYHLLTTSADYDQCVAYSGNRIPSNNFDARSAFNWNGTFVYNGKVYDNIKYRLRQRNARYSGAGKRSFRFRFNRGNEVQFHDVFGNPYPTKWRTLNSHKMSTRSDSNYPNLSNSIGLYEAINAILWNLTGTPAPQAHWFHFRVVKGAVEAPPGATGKYFGDFYGLLLGMEDYDSRFLDAHNLEKGNLYKLKSYVLNGLEVQRYQAFGAVTNASDYSNIINSLRPDKTESWIRRYVDMDSWYHYHAIVDAVRHYDVQPNIAEHLKNRAYYFAPDGSNRLGKLHVLPWDSDTSWGPNWNGGVDFVKNAMVNNSSSTTRARLNTEYRNVVREIRDLVWQEDQIHGLIDLLEDKVAPFQRADLERWTGAPAAAGRQTDPLIRLIARDMKTFAFLGGKRWVGGEGGDAISRDSNISGSQGRDAYLDALAADTAIPATPVLTDLSAPGHPANGLVFQSSAFSDPSGTLAAMEYRLAETGAYLNDGQPFPLEWSASWESGELDTFTETIVPPASAVRGGKAYRARVRHKDSTGRWSHWSAPVEFVATEPDISILQQSLVISEIMYNPLGTSDLEYVELTNIGSYPLDLTDVRFTKGIDFDLAPGTTLAPGEFLLVVKNAAAFESHYGAGLPVAGEYQFEDENGLSNGGERIKLALGALPIHEFEYDNSLPWPTAADGLGYSIVLAHTSNHAFADPLDPLGHGVATNWRLSGAPDGSPGALDGEMFAGNDPDEDEDRDSLNAFLEHAVGSDDSDAASGPGLFAAGRDGDGLTFTYQRNLLADDVIYFVEISPDLVHWTRGGASLLTEIPNGDGTSTVTFKSDIPIPGRGMMFMRLRVSEVVPLEKGPNQSAKDFGPPPDPSGS